MLWVGTTKMKRAELDIVEHFAMTSDAGAWVRAKYQIPPEYVINEEFEREFNCKLELEPGSEKDSWAAPVKIVFNTPEDMTLFLLRWGK